MSSSQVTIKTGTKRSRASSSSRSVKARVARGLGGRKNIVKTGTGFPEKINTTLRYVDNVAIDTALASGQLNKYLFSANGIYDPDISSTGHQPLGFDNWMAIYNHFTVNSATIKATFYANGDLNEDIAMRVGIYDDDSATNTITVNALSEGSTRDKNAMITSHKDQVVLRSNYKARQIFGSADLSDTSLRGTISANPSEIHSWVLYAYNWGTTTDRIDCLVDIEYNVTFYERKDLTEQ